jgi:hypothetical protein
MNRDQQVRASLLAGMQDLQNLLVHLQTVLHELAFPIIRAGGGLTFSGFSIRVSPEAPVDWIGYHLDRPDVIVFQIQDRTLPDDCPLSDLKRLQVRQYERVYRMNAPFFQMGAPEQMEQVRLFVQETADYLNGLLPEKEDAAPVAVIPIL